MEKITRNPVVSYVVNALLESILKRASAAAASGGQTLLVS